MPLDNRTKSGGHEPGSPAGAGEQGVQPDPLIAAVIIARNEERFIGRCIASVLASLAPFEGAEVVLVDSRSADRTLEVARRFPISVVQLRNSVALSAALGRVVGERLTRSQYILFVDGDTEIEGAWVREALLFLTMHEDVAGVCGKLREVYYKAGAAIGEHSDFFLTSPTPEAVEDPGGNAIYRRASLAAVGSFNPTLVSYEEAELTGRLRCAGFSIVRLPVMLGTHHTGLRGSLSELRRRYRDNLIKGYGQALRVSIGTPLLWTHVRRQKRYLQFQAMIVFGIATAIASIVLRDALWIGAWSALCALLILVFMLKSRSITKPFRLIADWSVWSIPLALGFLERPKNLGTFTLEDMVERVEKMGL